MPETSLLHQQTLYAATDSGLSREDIRLALESALAPLAACERSC